MISGACESTGAYARARGFLLATQSFWAAHASPDPWRLGEAAASMRGWVAENIRG